MNKWVRNGLHKAEPMATQQGSTQGELYNNAKDKLSTLQIAQTLHMSDRYLTVYLNNALFTLKDCTSRRTRILAGLN